ncbi:DUF6924 domain-containing protein [Streptomyces sp. NPDC090303]|uniref:DUF6924 domain-containing protein n=1 Tax=Streptomyces sp. NPDC090303 TaxID=3365960 RepID=UPI00380480B6
MNERVRTAVRALCPDPAEDGRAPAGEAGNACGVSRGHLGQTLDAHRGRAPFDALVIRTDFSDDEVWNAVVEELGRPWGPYGEIPSSPHVIDDPDWSGATAEDVLAVVEAQENVSAVFLADRQTMETSTRALRALTKVWDDEKDFEFVYFQPAVGSTEPQDFRIAPAEVHTVHANLTLGNVDFSELAAAASMEPDRVLRSGWRGNLSEEHDRPGSSVKP